MPQPRATGRCSYPRLSNGFESVIPWADSFPSLSSIAEKTILRAVRVDVELINIPPTLAVTALVSGDLQYVIFAGTTLNAAVRGLPVKLVMVYNDRPLFSLMSRP